MNHLFKILLRTSIAWAVLTGVIQTSFAQTDPLGPLSNLTEFTVKEGHDVQFREGIKTWMACYLPQNGNWTWSIWHRQQGEGSVYVLASYYVNWAEYDKEDPAGKDCQNLAISLINPHIEKATTHVARFLPAISKTTNDGSQLIVVTFFELNQANGYKFLPVVTALNQAQAKIEGSPRGYWYTWLTRGPESPNYHVATPYKDYAAMDVMRENIWTMYENEVGKAKRDEMQADYRSAVNKVYVYHYKLIPEISRPTR